MNMTIRSTSQTKGKMRVTTRRSMVQIGELDTILLLAAVPIILVMLLKAV